MIRSPVSIETVALTGGVCVAVLVWLRRRPASYPGDAIPPSKQLKREAKFQEKSHKVDAGWKPCVEAQSEVLPHQVSGQQVWVYSSEKSEDPVLFSPANNPNSSDHIFRQAKLKEWKGPQPDSDIPLDCLSVVRKGFSFYQMLQCDDGQWAGDYGGPHFLLPGFVIAAYITGHMDTIFPAPHCKAIQAYLLNHQQEDGGWGSHIESPSTMFGTVLNYVALRLVGVEAEEEACQKGRQFMRQHGGALYAPSWAKFWLAVLGVYEWQGIAPVPPEMWLLPQWFPLHPGRFWCHCRMVYLPMCWLYARRFTFKAAEDPIASALRSELYQEGQKYQQIEWRRYVHSVADIDNYSPIHPFMRVLQEALLLYERFGPWKWLRKISSDFALEYMQSEDLETNYLTIGPVSKALHLLASWVAAGGETDSNSAARSTAFRAHVQRVPAYLWVAEDGMKVQGYNGSMAWDTSFAMQAAVEGGLVSEFKDMSKKAWQWLVQEQVRSLPHGDWRHWRQPIQGGWGFSTAEQAWPVSDTTAEAFKAVLLLRKHACIKAEGVPMPDQHLFDTVRFLLSYQNGDGGWATYENNRGWSWYELLNPSEVFGDIMIDYSYVECSSSAMQALMLFTEQFPQHRAREIAGAIQRGARFIEAMQRSDGSWYGCWGNCFTYGCWFGIEGLLCAGRPASCRPIEACVKFLLGKQNSDGGWGEDFASCFNREYAAREKLYGCDSGSTVVQTSWALLALMAANCKDIEAVQRGIALLRRRQLSTGDWPQENVAGVFNRSIGITLPSCAFVSLIQTLSAALFEHHLQSGTLPFEMCFHYGRLDVLRQTMDLVMVANERAKG
ncbi:unnamed protein product [Durusdinium trenchii]|uniref:Terpene cyclase/mutase family member n=1 Tax=Durusdinium trenchii TaxID=1381693 RepID=A0ABP0JUL3_9DINO